jgi:ribosome-associated toxin RatA of RatAB toxin-antitoxin module
VNETDRRAARMPELDDTAHACKIASMRSVRRGRMRLLCRRCAFLSVAALLVVAYGARAELDSGQLTSEELGRLNAGALVQRPATRMHGGVKLMGGSSWQLINASPDVVWRALLDTQYYHRMMPQVLEAKLIAEQADQRTVFMRQGAAGLIETTYYLNVKVDAARRGIRFSVDDRRPHDIVEAVWGFYSVRPHADGKTLLAYGVMADIRGGILASVMRSTMHEWMLRTPWMIKRFVEGSGRWIYRRAAS